MRHVLVEVVWLDNSSQEMELVSNQRPCSPQSAAVRFYLADICAASIMKCTSTPETLCPRAYSLAFSIHKILGGRDERNPQKAPEFTASHFEQANQVPPRICADSRAYLSDEFMQGIADLLIIPRLPVAENQPFHF
jgi:hypothetical protein